MEQVRQRAMVKCFMLAKVYVSDCRSHEDQSEAVLPQLLEPQTELDLLGQAVKNEAFIIDPFLLH